MNRATFFGTQGLNARLSWSSYWTQRSLFFLDGTIITVGENKYFKDRSSAARNFLITGYDFDSTWTKGFPYKSAATISAPAADAALIAADVNNFLYAADGTPNQIPVVSLFQNIDYANTIYCKHSAQVLDANGVETYEPRVSEIFMTATPLSASDLVKANTYFGVPTEVATALWVDPIAGSDDAPNDGTKAKPYKTLAKMSSVVGNTDNKTIYVKNGVSEEFETYFSPKGNTWIALGKFTILGKTGGNAAFYFLNNGGKLYNFIIDGAGLTYAAYFQSGTGNEIHRCKIFNSSYIRCFVGGGIYDSVLICEPVGYAAGITLLVQGCLSNAPFVYVQSTAATSGTITIQYCKAVGTAQSIISSKGSQNIITNYNKSANWGTLQNGVYTGSVTIKHNQFTPSLTSGKLIGTPNSNTTDFEWTIENNIITWVANTGAQLVYLNNAKVASIKNNISKGLTSLLSSGGIQLDNPVVKNTLCVIQNNYISRGGNTDDTFIMVGNETVGGGDNNLSGAVIVGNCIINAGVGNMHAIFISRTNIATVKYNYIVNSALGIVFKDTGGDFSGSICEYNLIKNCVRGITVKGVVNLKCYGNTIYNDLHDDAYLYEIIPNGESETSGLIIKNNILCDLSESGTSEVYHDLGTDLVIDNNVVFSANNAISNSEATWLGWVGAGNDENSVNQNPSLNASLIPAIPFAIGENLGEANDDGLDVSANWGDANTVPLVVTKQQGASWQTGAYVK